ncbi:hypothetical protein K7W42_12975 [Deinococcus sp. HMF7604]|uniref:hypothetical protein n=1 Tax=Deinococcus betulae TaxID=2873312 RepID=UPI001CCF16F8|nr:hypothetical protein [Deinococcus betulae]MBZ9751770.1 hypothetical protein [Deinococcus betulae]
MDEHAPITADIARVLTGLHLRRDFPLLPEQTIAQLALHLIDTAEALRGPLAQIAGAQLHYQLDPEDRTLHIVAHAVDLERSGSAGVSVCHLAHLLLQDDFLRTGGDMDLRRNLYAIAFRAQLAQRGEPADESFGRALELANSAVEPAPLYAPHLN